MPFPLLLGLAGPIAATTPVAAPVAAAPAGVEQRLADMVNAYRQAHGLPRVPFSPALTRVAVSHARDMAARADGGASNDLGTDERGARCTLHSWSAVGRWQPLCYTADHARAAGMWNKPREITGGAYPGDGYEIAYWHSEAVTPEQALEGWRTSAVHDAMIREAGMWKGSRWQAMGVGIAGHYAFIWFGKEPDRAEVLMAKR